MKQWVLPAAIGAAVVIGLLAWQALPENDEPAAAAAPPPLAPFTNSSSDADLLVVAPAGNDTVAHDPTVSWRTAYVGTRPAAGTDSGAATTGARFGIDDYNATRVTAYIFTGDGALLASNGPSDEVAQYPRHPDFFWLPNGTWYLGTGNTPPGTTALPALRAEAHAALTGTPVGGVATASTNAYAWLWDTIWLTARVEAVQAAQ